MQCFKPEILKHITGSS